MNEKITDEELYEMWSCSGNSLLQTLRNVYAAGYAKAIEEKDIPAAEIETLCE